MAILYNPEKLPNHDDGGSTVYTGKLMENYGISLVDIMICVIGYITNNCDDACSVCDLPAKMADLPKKTADKMDFRDVPRESTFFSFEI